MQTGDRKTKGERRRAEVLQIARAQLIDRGYDAFSMREVAAGLGTKLGHIQYYFPTRHDLLEALVREEYRMNLEAIDEIAGKEPPSTATLEAVVRKLVDVWMSEGARIYVIMPFLALQEERFRALNREVNDDFTQTLQMILRHTHPADEDDVRMSKARMITAVMDGGLLQGDTAPGLVDEIVATVLLIADG